MDRISQCTKRWAVAAIGLLWGMLALCASAGQPVTGAAFTTTNTNIDGTGHCKNGNEAVNCNIYDGKQYVWLSGGPLSAAVGDGTYFFAVLAPGGQGGNENPNDGTEKNLSDISPTSGTGAGDAWTNRMFSISGGTITNLGSHDFDSNKIRLMPYDDTPNPGGVYILAICRVPDSVDPSLQYPPGVDPSSCKYDAFKVLEGDTAAIRACKFNDLEGNGINDPTDPLLPGWKITAFGLTNPSDVIGSAQITDASGCVDFKVTNLAGPITLTEEPQNGWIQTAPNASGPYDGYTGDATGMATVNVPMTSGQELTIYFGNYNVQQGGRVQIAKTAIPEVKYSWTISKDVDKTLVKQVGGTATFNYTVKVEHTAGTWKVSGDITISNSTILTFSGLQVKDTIDNGGTCAIDPKGNGTFDSLTQTVTGVTIGGSSFVYMTYSCTFNPATITSTTGINTISLMLSDDTEIDFDPQAYDFSTNVKDECVAVTDSYAGTLGNVCVGDANPTSFTYARTISMPAFDCTSYDNTATFTTNDTGTTGSASQTVTVCGPAKTGALTMGFWQNKNGQGIITGGSSTAGVCNSGTWLRSYAPFQDLSATATCAQVATYVTNVIKAANASGAAMNAMLKAQMLATALDVYFSDPALGGNKISAPAPIGGVAIDLTKICKDIATCSIYENTSAAFGGASSLTVSQILAYAASQSNAGGTSWYGQVKSTQELAKDTFDAINNQRAFAP